MTGERPARPVAFYVGLDFMPWSPLDIESRGLGGSETAVVRVASELARTRPTSVYADVSDAVVDRVRYRHRSSFDRDGSSLVVIRALHLLDERPQDAATTVWVQDVSLGDAFTPERAARVGSVLAVSLWHRDRLAAQYPFAAHQIRIVRNGITPAYFAPKKKRAPRVLFTSRPERGLDVLLTLWPEVRRAVPNAELAFCWAPVYDALATASPSLTAFRERVARLAKQPGVRALGSLGQRQLADLMVRSSVWAHPSWYSPLDRPFEETSCIGAMEAQAAGLAVVATAFGALPETVEVGTLIDGTDAPGGRWRDRFVDAIVLGLTDDSIRAHAAEEGPRAASRMSWRDRAAVFAAELERAEAIAA